MPRLFDFGLAVVPAQAGTPFRVRRHRNQWGPAKLTTESGHDASRQFAITVDSAVDNIGTPSMGR
jgi:hypothetical protein